MKTAKSKIAKIKRSVKQTKRPVGKRITKREIDKTARKQKEAKTESTREKAAKRQKRVDSLAPLPAPVKPRKVKQSADVKPAEVKTVKPAKPAKEKSYPFLLYCGHFSYWLNDDCVCTGCPTRVMTRRGERGNPDIYQIRAFRAYFTPAELEARHHDLRSLSEANESSLTDVQKECLQDLKEWKQKNEEVLRRRRQKVQG